MKKIYTIGLILTLFFVGIASVNAYASVKGYYRSNGTYVAPYVRSNPNGLKYDNYGYKPSQGLYNSTYGTRGTTWDTPTYITDPNYYTGKSLYDSGLTSYNHQISSNSQDESGCPIGASFNGYTGQPCVSSTVYSVGQNSINNSSCFNATTKYNDLKNRRYILWKNYLSAGSQGAQNYLSLVNNISVLETSALDEKNNLCK